MGLETAGKILLGVGAGIIVIGGLFILFAKLGWTSLPGTWVYRGKNITVIIPIGLMIVLSIVLSVIFHFLGRR